MRVRILVAEDQPVNQRLAVSLLESLGFQVDVVATGANAIEAVARFPYAAVLMDVEMPVMDGLQATKEIRRRERSGRRTPIIALAASEFEGGMAACLAAGMDDRVSKPASRQELREVLARCGVPVQPTEPVPAAEDPPPLEAPIDRERLVQMMESVPYGTDFLCQLMRTFGVDVASQLGALREAATSGAVLLLADLAHALRDRCAKFGASGMVMLCEDLEFLSCSGSLAHVEQSLARLEAEAERVSSALTAEPCTRPST